MELDHALITTLVEHWRLEMHMFHLLHREMGITLQDIKVMLGVPVDGLLVTGGVKLDWPALCRELLGHHPLDLIPHPHENKSILTRARLRVTWLEAQFTKYSTFSNVCLIIAEKSFYQVTHFEI